MLKDNFRSLYRYIIRHKFYTFFNILGLATGLTAVLLILFYIQDELSYDRHYANHERIYRLESTFIVNNNPDPYATFPIPLGPALRKEIPEIEEVTRIHVQGEMLMEYKDRKFYESGFVYADSTLFFVFSHPFVRGNPETCLKEPNSIVLTETVALRYFGDEDPLGKVLTDANGGRYRVTAIIRDLPLNTHLKYGALISMSTLPEEYSTTKPSRFWRVILYTYALINENASIEDVHRKFQDFYTREMEPLGQKFNVSFELMTTPLKDTHFRQGLIAEQPSGNKTYLVIFSAIALFILLIASINYMNMATARSANRSKEVGIRKVLGADRRQLVRQFLGESMSLSVVSLLFALLLVGLLLPGVNDFTGKEIRYGSEDNVPVFGGILLITLVIGMVSGSYPALYLSSFQPTAVLKGSFSKAGKGSRNLRKILVTVQFFIAVFMVIASMVVSGQLDFLRSRELGYQPEEMVIIQSGEEGFNARMESFKNELLQNPAVVSASNSHGIPGILRNIRSMKIEQEEGMTDRSILYWETDFDFCSTYGIEVVSGRDFDPLMGTDSLEAVLINETAALEFGWADSPLGKRIHYGFAQDGSGGRMLKVVGVMKDFHFYSLHNAIEPLILFIQEYPGDLLSVRLHDKRREETIQFLEEKWLEFGASGPFRFQSLVSRLDEAYESDDRTGTIIRLGSLFVIILALLGLLGLASFVAEQKAREVGIRKIHGATVEGILFHLYRDFISLFVLAFTLAVPLAWWRLMIWLESEFVYHIDLQWTTFLYAGLFCILVGTLTVSYFVIRTARGNPVDAIKYE